MLHKYLRTITGLFLLTMATTGCGDKTLAQKDKDLLAEELKLIDDIKSCWEDDLAERETALLRAGSIFPQKHALLLEAYKDVVKEICRLEKNIKDKTVSGYGFKTDKEEEGVKKLLEIYKKRRERMELALGVNQDKASSKK